MDSKCLISLLLVLFVSRAQSTAIHVGPGNETDLGRSDVTSINFGGWNTYYAYMDKSVYRCITCDCSGDSTNPDSTSLQATEYYCYPTANQVFYVANLDWTEASPTSGSSSAFIVISPWDHKCLTINYDSSASLYWVTFEHCDFTSSDTKQQWKNINQYGDYAYLENQSQTGKCVTPSSYSTDEGTKFHLWGCDNKDYTQLFHFKKCDGSCPNPP